MSNPNLTFQRAFQRVWQHFIVDHGKYSLGADGECKYRGPNGAKCAVGLFIKDADYHTGMERLGVFGLTEGLPAGYFGRVTKMQLVALQCAHDTAAKGLMVFEPQMRTLAREHGLKVPE